MLILRLVRVGRSLVAMEEGSAERNSYLRQEAKKIGLPNEERLIQELLAAAEKPEVLKDYLEMGSTQ